jgi:hypothetical protein
MKRMLMLMLVVLVTVLVLGQLTAKAADQKTTDQAKMVATTAPTVQAEGQIAMAANKAEYNYSVKNATLESKGAGIGTMVTRSVKPTMDNEKVFARKDAAIVVRV